jgi:nucleoid-associated protein YgaU
MRALTLLLVVLAVTFLVMGCANKREELPQPEPGDLKPATPALTPAVVEKPAVIETPPAPPPPVRVERPATIRPPVERPPVEKPSTPATYTVKKGDSLSKIAKRMYGDENAWHKIFDANKDKIKDANKLKVGTVLTIPPK